MSVIIRDLLLSDIGPAVRLLEECISLADTKPADSHGFKFSRSAWLQELKLK